jgi:hydroxymethylglutaryl-CoA lyase
VNGDLPHRVEIIEEGPREGFQIEPGLIPTQRKIQLIETLGRTGLKSIQIASFVDPKRVPGWADADAVVAGYNPQPGIDYSAIWLNDKGFLRAVQHGGRLQLKPTILTSASSTFMVRNQGVDLFQNIEAQQKQINLYRKHGIAAKHAMVMAAFGCNFEGDITTEQVAAQIEVILDLAGRNGVELQQISLADTMGWGSPTRVKKLVDMARSRWPDMKFALHLHDTRGSGLANAFAGLLLGIDSFDTAVAGLGGCPFAGHREAAGNVCTEDFAFLCEEMGVSTGLDLDALLEAAHLAEDIVGHPLPGKLMRGGTLSDLRRTARAAAMA